MSTHIERIAEQYSAPQLYRHHCGCVVHRSELVYGQALPCGHIHSGGNIEPIPYAWARREACRPWADGTKAPRSAVERWEDDLQQWACDLSCAVLHYLLGGSQITARYTQRILPPRAALHGLTYSLGLPYTRRILRGLLGETFLKRRMGGIPAAWGFVPVRCPEKGCRRWMNELETRVGRCLLHSEPASPLEDEESYDLADLTRRVLRPGMSTERSVEP